MTNTFLTEITQTALAGGHLDGADALRVLTDTDIDLLSLVNAAWTVRKANWGRGVQVHIINNAANGKCPEDCSYCTQGKNSSVEIEEYSMKSREEILAEAQRAHENGAFRYCMVFSGRGPSATRTEELASLVREIKDSWPIEVCVSAGLLDDGKASVLADAGLDRLNHNLNTSEEHYAEICTTHTYQDRLETLRAAKRNGIETCSGLIAGMGEPATDLVEIAQTLRELEAESIPVNFLLPFEGNDLIEAPNLTPDYCLRVLAMFRFTNPTAEIRIAAGREFHLRSMEVMALYVANSLFLEGYLNAKGAGSNRTYEMIADAGFEIVSQFSAESLVAQAEKAAGEQPVEIGGNSVVKTLEDLRPKL
jgi:biotin synthase